MDVKPIETDEEYWAVCAALEPILFSAEPNSPEGNRAEMQLLLVRAYEAQNPHLADDPERMPLGAMIDAFLQAAEELGDPPEM